MMLVSFEEIEIGQLFSKQNDEKDRFLKITNVSALDQDCSEHLFMDLVSKIYEIH